MQHFFENVREGMNVCDLNGDKVGTIKAVHQLGRTVGGVAPTTGAEGYVHLDTGFLGLGKDLYIPFNSFRDCTGDCCFLNIPKDDINRMGWDRKPSNIV